MIPERSEANIEREWRILSGGDMEFYLLRNELQEILLRKRTFLRGDEDVLE